MTYRRSLFPLVAALALVPASAAAQHAVVSAEQVQALLAAPKTRAVVIDARSTAEYAQGHIPGAISIPAERLRSEARRLPEDHSTPLVFYCRGYG